MPDVIDFLVLRQSYDEALRRNWQPSKLAHTFLYISLMFVCFNSNNLDFFLHSAAFSFRHDSFLFYCI